MVQVNARPNENIDSLWKRFKRAVENDGVLGELRKREAYEKPSVRRKKKSIAARKREAKRKDLRERVSYGINFKFSDDRTKKIYQRVNRNPIRRPPIKRQRKD